MSDDYLRIIPTDPSLVPPKDVAQQLVALVGPEYPEADEVVAESYGHPIFVDQGANLEAIICPSCKARLRLEPFQEVDPIRDWWYDLTDPLGEGSIAGVEATMPCCAAVVPFASLEFDWPAGVASFEISVMNPRVPDEPRREVREAIESLLGCAVKHVWAHY